MKILLSSEQLSNVNSFSEGSSSFIKVFDNWDDVTKHLLFETHHTGEPSVRKYLKRHPVWMYQLPDNGVLLTRVGN